VGYLNRHGRLAIPCILDAATSFRSGRALVIREGVRRSLALLLLRLTLWSFADEIGIPNIPARHGCVLVTITDTLTGEVWRRDCGPGSLAFRAALLIGSAAHCHIYVPGLPPVAAVIEEIPIEAADPVAHGG